jgi:hypothetical protein
MALLVSALKRIRLNARRATLLLFDRVTRFEGALPAAARSRASAPLSTARLTRRSFRRSRLVRIPRMRMGRGRPDSGRPLQCVAPRPALVQGRDHLRAARPRVLRQQRRRHRRLPRADQKLDYLRTRRHRLWLLPFYPSPLRDDGYDIADYDERPSELRHARRLQRFLDEAHRAASGHHRAGHQPHLRPAPVVPARAPRPPGARARLLRLERHAQKYARRASSSPTPRPRTGRGTRSPGSTTGTASSHTSRT